VTPEIKQAVIASVLREDREDRDARAKRIACAMHPVLRRIYPKNIGKSLLLYDVNAWLCTNCWDSLIDQKVPGLGDCDCQTCGEKMELEKVPDAVFWVYDDEIIL